MKSEYRKHDLVKLKLSLRRCHMVRGCLDLEKSIQFIIPKKSTFATIELFYVEKISDFVDVNSI